MNLIAFLFLTAIWYVALTILIVMTLNLKNNVFLKLKFIESDITKLHVESNRDCDAFTSVLKKMELNYIDAHNSHKPHLSTTDANQIKKEQLLSQLLSVELPSS